MPDLDGIEVMRQLRERRPVPVILLTAKGSTADKAKGLDLGADDYIAKPFHPDELAARVRAVLRRSSGVAAGRRRPRASTTSRSTSSGGWSRRNGELVQLSRTEWLLLQHLAAQRRQGRPPHRAPDQGLGPGVPRRPPVPAGLGQSRVRRKLGAKPGEPGRIKTFQGIGYLLDVDSPSQAAAPAAATDADDDDAGTDTPAAAKEPTPVG